MQATTPAMVQPAGAVRAFHDTIDLSGRLSVRYQKNGKDEALHGSFTWSQSPERTLVTLLSPLGQIVASIEVTPGKATLTQAGQPPRIAADVNLLTADALGWPLPIAGLGRWLQGFGNDTDNKPFVATQSGAGKFSTRDGWRIQYASWQDEGAPDQGRPKRIDLERSTAAAGEVAIRIVIDSAQVPQASAQ